MAIQSMAEYFGCDAYDVFHEAKNAYDTSQGYLAGTIYAQKLQETILEEHSNKSRAFREGILTALREQL